jgi:hypothetical protein
MNRFNDLTLNDSTAEVPALDRFLADLFRADTHRVFH